MVDWYHSTGPITSKKRSYPAKIRIVEERRFIPPLLVDTHRECLDESIGRCHLERRRQRALLQPSPRVLRHREPRVAHDLLGALCTARGTSGYNPYGSKAR
eukprot:3922698-Prymnesium_polylepis.1